MAQKRHYRAFISYSHADRAVAQWLHRALERYRLPPRLVGTVTDVGIVPAKLTPIFRDRDELPAAGNLTDELRDALLESDFLVVVASPAAAASHWVNEEIRLFKAMHGEAHVLALIAAGNAGERGSAGAFPPALRFHVGADGVITDRQAEPIAADLRPGADGKRLAKLKLVAGLTGLPLDALAQREAQRRQRWLAGIATASLALVAVMAVLTVLAIQGQREAERQRAEADGLIEFMLTDLRAKLEPVGRLDALDAVGQRAMAYYGGQNPGRLDPDALGRRARALMLVGEVRDLRGNGDGAVAAYEQAERSTAELLARDPADPDRMYDHAQSLFYVGQLAWQRRDWDKAEDRFRRYAALADRMLATDPDNPKWQAEVGYAANSLGAVLLERGEAPAAIAQFERYAAVRDALAKAAPADADMAWEASQARAWLADAHRGAGRYADARAARLDERAMLARLLEADPGNTNVRMSQGRADQALADLDLASGDVAAAVARAAAASGDLRALLARDPANSLWRDLAVGATNTHAEALMLAGRWTEAEAANRWALANARQLMADDPENRRWKTTLLMPARWAEIAILFGQGRDGDARIAIARFHAELGPTRQADLASGASTSWTMLALIEATDLAARGEADRARAVAAAGAAIREPAPGPLGRAAAPHLIARANGRPPPITDGYPVEALLAAFGA